ncbi:PCRF domain-containing protein [Nesterenkonia ebinurensis]|uniref:PCRF domain-containing protein n=1 Tax=Nesterenkonia ebinurensis TaxID=2608252 RepID=UPI00123DEF5F|nr:PCRF domain-containing protein [Nesterenkonia ebinurensis]
MSTLTTRSKTLGGAAGVLGLLTVTACGGGDAESYCNTLEEHASALQALESDDPQAVINDGFEGVVEMLQDAESDVPDEIAEEHAAVQSAVEELATLDLEALFDMESMMEMDPEELQALEAEFEQLEERFNDMEDQGEAWADWVEENCDIEGFDA